MKKAVMLVVLVLVLSSLVVAEVFTAEVKGSKYTLDTSSYLFAGAIDGVNYDSYGLIDWDKVVSGNMKRLKNNKGGCFL